MKVIEKYLEAKTEHSLLINGKWGSGKTYFIKNKLDKIVTNKINIIYTSANGIESFDEIMTQIFSSKFLLNKVDNRYSRVALSVIKAAIKIGTIFPGGKLLENLFKSIEIKKEDLIDLVNDVLIIDDIERINFKKFPISDFLGTINNLFTEHSNVKVILISDENELIKILGDEEGKRYNLIKEKTIWRTIVFKPNFLDTIANFIDQLEIQSDIKEELNKHTHYIIDLLDNSQTENLRNLKFYLEILTEVILIVGLEKFQKIYPQLLQSIFIICKEYKDGKIEPESYILPKDYIKGSRTISGYLFDTATNEKSPLNQQADLIDIYKMIFNKLGNDYIFVTPIYHLITTGEVDPIDLLKELENIIGNQDVQNAWNIALNTIKRFESISSEEFKQNYKSVVEYIIQGKYDAYSLIVFLNFSIFFIENGIQIKFTNVSQLFDFIYENIMKSEDVTHYEYWGPDLLSKGLIVKYPALNKIIDKIKEIHNRKWELINEENSKNILKRYLMDYKLLEENEFMNMMTFLPESEFEEIFKKYIEEPLFPGVFNSFVRNKWPHFRRDENTKRDDKLDYIIKSLKMRIAPDDTINLFHLKELTEILKLKKGG